MDHDLDITQKAKSLQVLIPVCCSLHHPDKLISINFSITCIFQAITSRISEIIINDYKAVAHRRKRLMASKGGWFIYIYALTISVCFLNHLLDLSVSEVLTQILCNVFNVCSRYLSLDSNPERMGLSIDRLKQHKYLNLSIPN